MPATVFGVPTHPLTVHAAVVLVPLAVIAVVVAALWPAARRRYGPVVLILATLALVSVPVAKESGESLARRLPGTPLIQQHMAMADGLLPWAAGLWIAAVAVVVLPWVWSLATSAQAPSRGSQAFGAGSRCPRAPRPHRGEPPSAALPGSTGPEPLLPGPGPAGTRGDRLVSRLGAGCHRDRSRRDRRGSPRVATPESRSTAAALAGVTAVGSRGGLSAPAIRGPKRSGPTTRGTGAPAMQPAQHERLWTETTGTCPDADRASRATSAHPPTPGQRPTRPCGMPCTCLRRHHPDPRRRDRSAGRSSTPSARCSRARSAPPTTRRTSTSNGRSSSPNAASPSSTTGGSSPARRSTRCAWPCPAGPRRSPGSRWSASCPITAGGACSPRSCRGNCGSCTRRPASRSQRCGRPNPASTAGTATPRPPGIWI